MNRDFICNYMIRPITFFCSNSHTSKNLNPLSPLGIQVNNLQLNILDIQRPWAIIHCFIQVEAPLLKKQGQPRQVHFFSQGSQFPRGTSTISTWMLMLNMLIVFLLKISNQNSLIFTIEINFINAYSYTRCYWMDRKTTNKKVIKIISWIERNIKIEDRIQL